MVVDGKKKFEEQEYWNQFYQQFELSIPSQFAVFTAVDLRRSSHAIVEFGCGNARDSLFFAKKGFAVMATDKSNIVIERNNRISNEQKLKNICFAIVDVSDESKVSNAIEQMKKMNGGKTLVVYSRFFLHTLTDDEQGIFVSSLSSHLEEGDIVYFEYRCTKDSTQKKTFANHYRRFVDTNQLVKNIQNLGFELIYSISGKGMARFKDEDAFVSRLILQKI